MVLGFFFIASISDTQELNQDYPHFRDWQADVKRHCESATLSNHGGGKIHILRAANPGTSIQTARHWFLLQRDS